MRFTAGGTAGGAALYLAIAAAVPASKSPQPANAPTSLRPDTGIVVSDVHFPSGTDDVPAILAHPAGAGQYPVVIIIHANSLREPYIREAAELVARGGFVALAIDLFHFFPQVPWEEFRQIPRDSTRKLMDAEFREERVVRNLKSGIDYVRALPFGKAGGVGLLGFCGGGWSALIGAAQLVEVTAAVPFYAPVALSDSTRRSVLDVAEFIRVPVQFHAATNDQFVPVGDVERFVAELEKAGTPIEVFTYPAQHGFVASNRPSYDSASARLAWSRTLPFLRANIGGPVKQRSLAPPFRRQPASGGSGGSAALPLHSSEHGGH